MEDLSTMCVPSTTWTGGKPQRHRDQTTRQLMVEHNGDQKCPTPFYTKDWTHHSMYHVWVYFWHFEVTSNVKRY